MSEDQQPEEAMMNAIADPKTGTVRLGLMRSCHISVNLDFIEAHPILTLTMTESTAKELFVVLHKCNPRAGSLRLLVGGGRRRSDFSRINTVYRGYMIY